MNLAASPAVSAPPTPVAQVNSEAPPVLSAKDHYKQMRKANQLTQKAIDQELDSIAGQVDRLIRDASERIGVDVAELTGQFLAKSTATHEKKPTAWNGLVSKVSSELAHKKEEPEFRGAAFMRYVVQYIHDNNLYKDLTEKQKEELVAYTQKVRDDRVNAGQTKTIDQRLSQGSVKDEIFAMCKRLRHLHSLIGVEFLFITVRGTPKQGLKPVYYASPKSRQFFEMHLKLEMANIIPLLEESIINGAAGVVKEIQKTKTLLKTELHERLTNALRDVAIKPASDGWEPITEDRYAIKMSYVNFKAIKETFGVDVFGWPMGEDGSMKDPSDLGGSQALRQWIVKVEAGKVGFSRMTKDEHQAWLKEYKEDLVNKTIKVCNKTQKRLAIEGPSTAEPPHKKKTHPKTPTTTEGPGSAALTPATPSRSASTTPTPRITAEMTVPSSTDSLATATPLANFEAVTANYFPSFDDSVTPSYSFETPPAFNQPSFPSTPATDIFDLSNYEPPSLGFEHMAIGHLSQSPTYPLVPVSNPHAGRIGFTQCTQQDSITSQTSDRSVQSQHPTTPTTPHRRRDSFVNTSPADWAARSQRQPRRRTRTGSSTPSHVNTPAPQDLITQSQSPDFTPTTNFRATEAPKASLYRSELADPRM
ncbi:hypothetical protein FRC11_002291 [Ceratobasidium sp. 423]|nr:hypothetical protein FRC11_002291 [Ceratobasidium sp. 423]